MKDAKEMMGFNQVVLMGHVEWSEVGGFGMIVKGAGEKRVHIAVDISDLPNKTSIHEGAVVLVSGSFEGMVARGEPVVRASSVGSVEGGKYTVHGKI